MDLMGSANWAKFKSAIRDVTDTFMKEPVGYIKQIESLDRFDEVRADRYSTPIELPTLIEWDSVKNTESSKGAVNRETAKLTFDARVLAEHGLVDAEGKPTIDATSSMFIIMDVLYKVIAAYPDAQAEDENLLYIVEVRINPTQSKWK